MEKASLGNLLSDTGRSPRRGGWEKVGGGLRLGTRFSVFIPNTYLMKLTWRHKTTSARPLLITFKVSMYVYTVQLYISWKVLHENKCKKSNCETLTAFIERLRLPGLVGLLLKWARTRWQWQAKTQDNRKKPLAEPASGKGCVHRFHMEPFYQTNKHQQTHKLFVCLLTKGPGFDFLSLNTFQSWYFFIFGSVLQLLHRSV